MQGESLDHFEGLGISISTDDGGTWSDVRKLFDWGRHHPSLVLLPNGEIVITYVVRKGYIDSPDGFPQFGVEAVVSRDHGQTWDLDHRYLLHTWAGNRKGSNQNLPGPQAWWASSQATSTVSLPDGNLLTAFGTGYRSQPNPNLNRHSNKDPQRNPVFFNERSSKLLEKKMRTLATHGLKEGRARGVAELWIRSAG